MRNYKHSNVDMGKIYIKIVANYFSFLVIPESPNHFPVGNQSLIWLADSKGFVASAWSWLEEIAWPCSTLCSTLSIATVSLETKPNKGPSYSCCQGKQGYHSHENLWRPDNKLQTCIGSAIYYFVSVSVNKPTLESSQQQQHEKTRISLEVAQCLWEMAFKIKALKIGREMVYNIYYLFNFHM